MKSRFIGLTFFCFLSLLVLARGFTQGALQEEPDPQRDLIRELRTSEDLRSLPEMVTEYQSPESVEIILAAYDQLSRALGLIQTQLESEGVDPIFSQLEQLNQILTEWAGFWKQFAFLPNTSAIRAQDISLFYQQISEIDQRITQSILGINELVNKERVLTGAGFRFPE